jgi:hypothetical protein
LLFYLVLVVLYETTQALFYGDCVLYFEFGVILLAFQEEVWPLVLGEADEQFYAFLVLQNCLCSEFIAHMECHEGEHENFLVSVCYLNELLLLQLRVGVVRVLRAAVA